MVTQTGEYDISTAYTYVHSLISALELKGRKDIVIEKKSKKSITNLCLVVTFIQN